MKTIMVILLSIAGIITAFFVIIIGITYINYLWNKPTAVPDRVEKLGCVEIVTHTYFYPTGWNTGNLGYGQGETYSIRYNGKAITVQNPKVSDDQPNEPESSFNAVFLFPSSQPALVINAGDPNNSSQYYLLRCEAEKPLVEFLGNSRSASVSAAWADPPAEADVQLNPFSSLRRMEGGRYLILGGTIVLDIQTLKHYTVPDIDGYAFYVGSFSAPFSGSPDKQSFAIYATTRYPENHPSIGVFNFITGEAYHLRMDLKHMRFNVPEDLNTAWFNHHFHWVSHPGKPDRLEVRPNFKPLPYKGHRFTEHVNKREYRIMNVAIEMQNIVIKLMEKEFGAVRLPSGNTPYQSPELRIGKQTINVSELHEDQDAYVSFWISEGPDDDLWVHMADRMDQELATGKYDNLFHQKKP